MRKLTYLLFVISLIACEKEGSTYLFPEIVFESISPPFPIEHKDSIIITIFYSDMDGDLGENVPDKNNLFVTDNRNDLIYKYRIPELSPSGSNIAIEGYFHIKINGPGITDESSSQKVNYDIYVKDRAENKSNTITTSSITIQQ